MENRDDQLLKTRYIFPGQLKLPVAVLHRVSETEKQKMVDFLNTFFDTVLLQCEQGKDLYLSLPLTPSRTLYVDYTNGKLTFFIEDASNELLTQTLTARDVTQLMRKEPLLVKTIQNCHALPPANIIHAKVVAHALHQWIDDPNKNRGSPMLAYAKFDNDLTRTT